MAGIDGILNKIDQTAEGFGQFDTNIFELEKRKKFISPEKFFRSS